MSNKRFLVIAGVAVALALVLGAGVLIGGIVSSSALAQGPTPGMGLGMMGRGLAAGGAFTGTMPCLDEDFQPAPVAGRPFTGTTSSGVQGFGRGMMGGAPGYGYDEVMLPSLAKVLGLTVDQLTAELKAGKTPVQIAAAKNISAEKLQELLALAHQATIQQLLKDGKLTKAQADAMDQNVSSITDRPCLTGELVPGGMGGRGRMMGRGR